MGRIMLVVAVALLGTPGCGDEEPADGECTGGSSDVPGEGAGTGGGAPTTDAPSPDVPPAECGPSESFVGKGTFYDWADGFGSCHFEPETGAQLVAALNLPQYDDAAMCGACIHASGPVGEATVLVVNACPECQSGHIDFSPEAYALLAEGYAGVPEITWQFVPCEPSGSIRYHYLDGSTHVWAWVSVRNHRHPIAKFEYVDESGDWVEGERQKWNYFKAIRMPEGGQRYRVTDIHGHVLEDEGVPVLDEGEVEGGGQFPPCE